MKDSHRGKHWHSEITGITKDHRVNNIQLRKYWLLNLCFIKSNSIENESGKIVK